MDGRVRLLGAFQLTMAGEPVELAPLGERLLAYLALHPNSCRELVAGVLWGEKGCAQATAGLRTALWRLPRPSDASLVRSDGNRLSLALELRRRPPALAVDVLAPCSTAAAPPASLDGFGRDLLPGWYDEWLVDEQERWRAAPDARPGAGLRPRPRGGRHRPSPLTPGCRRWRPSPCGRARIVV